MLVSPNMVTSNSSVSLLESLHLHRLNSHQQQKMIFKTDTNSSLEIIRFKAAPSSQQVSQLDSDSAVNVLQSADNVLQSADNVRQTAVYVQQSGGNVRQSTANVRHSAVDVENLRSSANVQQQLSDYVHQSADNLHQTVGNVQHMGDDVQQCVQTHTTRDLPGNRVQDDIMLDRGDDMILEHEFGDQDGFLDRSHLPPVPERFICDKCNYSTSRKSNYIKHVAAVHLKQKSVCLICGKKFTNLNQHYRVQHNTTNKVAIQNSLKREVLDHQTDLSTEQNFENSGQLDDHHDNDHCGQLNDQHDNDHCGQLDDHHDQDHCGQDQHDIYQTHNQSSSIRFRTKGDENNANIALPANIEDSFNSLDNEQSNLNVPNIHQQLEEKDSAKKTKISSKPRKKECPECGKCFSNLEQHIKIIHKKIKNFECVNCKRRFYDNRELINHHFQSLPTGQCRQSTREGDPDAPRKPFACNLCSYSANRKSNLNLHIESVHLKIKYSCPACHLQVASKPNLSQHMKNCKKYLAQNPTEKDPRRVYFPCKLCQYSTPRPSHLDRHVLSVHRPEALKTVTKVYEASTKSKYNTTTKSRQTPAQAPSSKLPFKFPQFLNLVNLETMEGGMNLDLYLQAEAKADLDADLDACDLHDAGHIDPIINEGLCDSQNVGHFDNNQHRDLDTSLTNNIQQEEIYHSAAPSTSMDISSYGTSIMKMTTSQQFPQHLHHHVQVTSPSRSHGHVLHHQAVTTTSATPTATHPNDAQFLSDVHHHDVSHQPHDETDRSEEQLLSDHLKVVVQEGGHLLHDLDELVPFDSDDFDGKVIKSSLEGGHQPTQRVSDYMLSAASTDHLQLAVPRPSNDHHMY